MTDMAFQVQSTQKKSNLMQEVEGFSIDTILFGNGVDNVDKLAVVAYAYKSPEITDFTPILEHNVLGGAGYAKMENSKRFQVKVIKPLQLASTENTLYEFCKALTDNLFSEHE